jgi:glutathione S-transferase
MPRARPSRVLWLLEEIGAPYELTEIRGADRRSVTESPAGNRFNQAAGALQAELGERDWLLGETFTVGDVICASVLEGATRETCWLTGPGSGPMWSAVRRAPPTRGRKRPGVNSAASRAEQLPPERPLPTEVQCAAGIQGPTPLMRCTA